MKGQVTASEIEATRRAIIDIGSNSVRLVIYEGPARTPFIVHNEKVQARLGRSLAATGAIDQAAYDSALSGCRRFKALIDAAGIGRVRTVATAAARDASNGPEFLEDLRAAGLEPELLTGEAEALASANGVLSAFPGADGVVGDLGGGSLELVDLKGGVPGRRCSFPLGVLRLPEQRSAGNKTLRRTVASMLHAQGWDRLGAGRPFYLVGGSWRALGHLDMHLSGSVVPGVHGYGFRRTRIRPMTMAIEEMGSRLAKTVPGISSSRQAGLGDAALLLGEVSARLNCGYMVVSTFGLREGLLFSELDPQSKGLDPLLAAVADYAQRRGNSTWHGDAVANWIEPVFADESPASHRVRRAACHLAGVDLHPLSETRARHGMELAWLGGWIGLGVKERAMLAQTMWTAWAGKGLCPQLEANFTADVLRQAQRWGEAIRLAERLTGGVSSMLPRASLTIEGDVARLGIDRQWRDLGGEVVAKQLAALAHSMGASAAMETR